MREERVVLEDDADAATVGRQMIDRAAVEGSALGLRDEASDDAQEGRLAAARRSEQGDEFAAADRQADIVHGDVVAEALSNAFDGDLMTLRGHSRPPDFEGTA